MCVLHVRTCQTVGVYVLIGDKLADGAHTRTAHTGVRVLGGQHTGACAHGHTAHVPTHSAMHLPTVACPHGPTHTAPRSLTQRSRLVLTCVQLGAHSRRARAHV